MGGEAAHKISKRQNTSNDAPVTQQPAASHVTDRHDMLTEHVPILQDARMPSNAESSVSYRHQVC